MNEHETNTDSRPYHIIGAGVVGLVTAYYLQKSGVTNIEIIERREKPCAGTSFANGGILMQSSLPNQKPAGGSANSKFYRGALDAGLLKFGHKFLKLKLKSTSRVFDKPKYLEESAKLFEADFRGESGVIDSISTPLGRIKINTEDDQRSLLAELEAYPNMVHEVVDLPDELKHGSAAGKKALQFNCDYTRDGPPRCTTCAVEFENAPRWSVF